MSSDGLNDNYTAQHDGREPDAHGQAALLLIESLLHNLIEKNIIDVADAVEIVGIATEVKLDTGRSLGDSPVTLQKSVALLRAISDSLKPDIA